MGHLQVVLKNHLMHHIKSPFPEVRKDKPAIDPKDHMHNNRYKDRRKGFPVGLAAAP